MNKKIKVVIMVLLLAAVFLILVVLARSEEFKWDRKTPTIKVYGNESYVYLPTNQNKGYQQTKGGYTLYFPKNDFTKEVPLILADPEKPVSVTLVKKEKK